MSRTGKIARLPKDIREQLNRRLEDGEVGINLVNWLNQLPECNKLLAERFGGKPISEQNLSEWKQGGYEDWVRNEVTRERVKSLVERADSLDGVANGEEISDRMGSLMAAELAEAIQKLDGIADSNERWRRLQEIPRELSRLRREDHHGKRLHIAKQRWEHEFEYKSEEERKADEKDRKDRLVDMFFGAQKQVLMAHELGGGEHGKKWADWLYRVQNGLRMPEWWTEGGGMDLYELAHPGQTKSNQIKVNQTKK